MNLKTFGLLMIFVAILRFPEYAFSADITNIESVGGSTFTATDDDGNVISENHKTPHKAQMRAIKHLQENCKKPECTAYVTQNFKLRITAKGDDKRVIISWDRPYRS